MKLLILTQKVDQKDPILGFFHRWIIEFAKHCEKITIICLQKGNFNLPDNVRVFSLGKEDGVSRLKYLWRFYKYIWRLRFNYDEVFVHMNPEYVILGGVLWRMWGKKISLWYIHKKVNFKLKLAEKITNKIFTIKQDFFKLSSRKFEYIGHGIDVEKFKKNTRIRKIENSILFVGRISSVKRLEILIEALKKIDEKKNKFVLNLVGEAGLQDEGYYKKIKILAKELEGRCEINFLGNIVNDQMPQVYNQNELLVNLTPVGSFDKVVLEAMSCETLVLVANQSFGGVVPKIFIFQNVNDLVFKLKNIFNLSKLERGEYGRQLRNSVVEKHNLEKLIEQIVNLIKK